MSTHLVCFPPREKYLDVGLISPLSFGGSNGIGRERRKKRSLSRETIILRNL